MPPDLLRLAWCSCNRRAERKLTSLVRPARRCVATSRRGQTSDMNEHAHTDEHWHGACGAGIFHAMFRLIAVSDLYGPARAIEWAQSLVDDPQLLSAFAHAAERPIASGR